MRVNFPPAWQERARLAEVARELQAVQEVARRAGVESREAAGALKRVEEELSQQHSAAAEEARRSRAAMVALAQRTAEAERADRRRRAVAAGARLGSVGVQRVGAALQEVWEDGIAFRELSERLRALAVAKEGVDAERKALKRRLPPPGMAQAAAAASGEYVCQEEYLLMEEALKLRGAQLKKEEEAAQRERERLDREKAGLLRELKRIRDEDASRFGRVPCLGAGRYALQSLLGRGGFSEVFKAFDVEEQRYVALKIHQLSPQWSEDRKRSYVRHAAREYRCGDDASTARAQTRAASQRLWRRSRRGVRLILTKIREIRT